METYSVIFEGEATDICTYGISDRGSLYATTVISANPMLIAEIPAEAIGTIYYTNRRGVNYYIKSATSTIYAVAATTNNGGYLAVTLVSDGYFTVTESDLPEWTGTSSYTDGWGISGYKFSNGGDGASSAVPVQESNPFESVIYYMGQEGFGAAVLDFITKGEPYVEPTDPYAAGGTSTTGGGTGNFDATSDTISIPNLPSVSAINTGFLTLFAPSLSQLQSLQQYLWGDLYQGIVDGSLTETVESLKKLVANPYDAILGLSIVPVSIPTAGSKDVKMYGVLDSGVSMPYASSQWATVDCGTLNINEFWGAYLDYAPYTKVTSLYLPYVGTVSVDVDEIMGKSLQVVYHIDILSGQCVAYIIINGSVEYQYQGHCSTSIPVTASDFSNAILSGLNLVGSATSVIAGGISGGLGGGIAGAITGAVSQAASQAPAVASNVMGMKPDIKAGGSVGGSGGLLSVQKPYLIAIRPRQSVAENQNSFTGYPVNMKLSVGDCSGYTEFETINLDGIPLTQPEKEELERILKGGVYL